MEATYDVVVIGGALSGAATATLLLRERPDLRVLIVERAPQFGRRVGESTVEISSYFLGRVLGLTQYLNEAHLVKQGLRFWFANAEAQNLGECSEIGARYLARIPGYQVDRATLDTEVLRRVCKQGAELWRPAVVQKVALNPGGVQTTTVRYQESTREVRSRWIIDASGVAALIARQEGWWRRNGEHPTTAVWSRWQGVKDWDGPELLEKYPKLAMACSGIRGTATNHFMGDGWWAWCIPLKGGDVSLGVVFDQRLVQWPEDGSLGERLKTFLCRHPAAREMLTDARWEDGDVHWRKNLPYCSTRFAGDGFVLVGDAAGFLDPFYSPGLDWLAYTASIAADLVTTERRGEGIAERVSAVNAELTECYERWFTAVYRDKYYYMGDYEIMRLAFLLDLGLYYLGVVSQPFRFGPRAFLRPMFVGQAAAPVHWLMSTFNRRFADLARARRARGCFGQKNHGQRFMFGGFTPSPKSGLPMLGALARWGMMEMREFGK